jgi:hypothetical protein
MNLESEKKQSFMECINLITKQYRTFIEPSLVDQIWEEVRCFNKNQIISLFRKMIEEKSYFANSVFDTRKYANMLHDKIRDWEKEQEKKDAKEFWEGTYHSDEVKWVVSQIKKRISGDMSDDDWKTFRDTIKQSQKNKNPRCSDCDDSGFVWVNKNSCDYVFKCGCVIGQRKFENLPVYIKQVHGNPCTA